MSEPTILVIGGSGTTGSRIARHVLALTDARIVVAGRDAARAEAVAARFGAEFPDRVTSRAIDVRRDDALAAGLAEVDLVVVAAPVGDRVAAVARVTLDSGADWLDILLDERVPATLAPLAAEIERAGRTFVTQAGTHPGLPAALVRVASTRFASIDRAAVAMAMRLPADVASSPETKREFAEIVYEAKTELYRGGEWRRVGMKDARRFDFGGGFGRPWCIPMKMEELHGLPERYGMSELGAWAAGFGPLVDWIAFPAGMLLWKVRPFRPLAVRMLHGAMRMAAKSPYGVVFLLEADGWSEAGPQSARIRVFHADAYEVTAIAVAACIAQQVEGALPRGLGLMGQVVDPVRLLRDMRARGAEIESTFAATDAAAEPR